MTQVIENICHHFRFCAIECDLAPIVPVASEVRDREHLMSPSGLGSAFMNSDAKGKICHLRGLPGAFEAASFSLHRRDAYAPGLTATWYYASGAKAGS